MRWTTAIPLTTIDQLSNGRLGAGWNKQEYRADDIPFESLRTRFGKIEEGIGILRALGEQPCANLDGRFFSLTDALCEPKRLQSPLLLWIGGIGENRTLQLVARYTQGWNAPYLTIDQFTRLS